MKTKEQVERTIFELQAIDVAYDRLRYLKVGPSNSSWKEYCKALNSELDALFNPSTQDEFFEETTVAVDYRDYDAVIEKCTKNAQAARSRGGYDQD
jgi:hypothetical protein